MNILVLHGGISNEREVSLRSGKAVANALIEAGHTVTLHDQLQAELDDNLIHANDVIFPVLHGTYGEDGALQGQLERLKCTFVGSDSTSSSLCFDKQKYRELMQNNLIPVANGEVVTYKEFQNNQLTQKPYVLKPIRGGSSLDTFIIHDVKKYPRGVDAAFDTYNTMLLEQLIEGREITVAVLSDSALPVVEIIPPAGSTFDYKNKYNGATQEICPPINVPPDVQQVALSLATEIHKLSGCEDYSRTDMIVTENGELVVLETNTSPGMTNQSLLPKAGQAAGYTMPQLCDQLVQIAIKRQTAAS